ncbi:MAG: VTT domain-containing protein [Cystobacter sp.]
MPDASTLAAWGLPGLFLVAVIAGSVLPAPSEAVLIALLYGGVRPELAVTVATVGNVLGSLTVYALGRWGARGGGRTARWLARRTASEDARLLKARKSLSMWGSPLLLLGWLPIVGDALVLAAGLVGVRPGPFLVFVSLGKGLRYLGVALSVLAATHTGISQWGCGTAGGGMV